MVGNPTQAERVARVLSDGEWHTTSEIQRRAGIKQVGSVVSGLRKKKGATVVADRIPKRKGPKAWRYKWQNIPEKLRLAVDPDVPNPGELVYEVPRSLAARYRLYVVPRYGHRQMLMDTAPTPQELGVKIVDLGEEGELDGCCLGILDSRGIPKEVFPGKWLLNPYEARAREGDHDE